MNMVLKTLYHRVNGINNKILKINSEEYPLLINEDESLWFDKTGTIYKANINRPLINQKKICTLEALAKK